MEYHRSLSWDLSSLTFLSVTWKRQSSAHSSCLQMTPNWDQYTGCHTNGYRQAAGMCHQEPYETQQGKMQCLAPAMDQPPGRAQAGDFLAGEQLCGKNPGGATDSKLDMQPQSALAVRRANCILSVWPGADSGSREVTIPLRWALIRSHLDNFLKLGHDLTATYSLKGSYKEDREKLPTAREQLHLGRFKLDVKEKKKVNNREAQYNCVVYSNDYQMTILPSYSSGCVNYCSFSWFHVSWPKSTAEQSYQRFKVI